MGTEKEAADARSRNSGLPPRFRELRLTPQDRIPSSEEDKPKKAASKRKADQRKAEVIDDDVEPQPRERKPRR